MTLVQGPAPVTTRERWLARLALAAVIAFVVVVLAAGIAGLTVLLAGVLALAVMLAGGWWYIAHRGLVRLIGTVVVVGAVVGVLAYYLARGVLWAVVAALALVALAVVAARAALVHVLPRVAMPEHDAAPAHQPYFVMNPRSGGGKVSRFDLDDRARGLGAEVALLDGPGPVDVAALARTAAADGADLLGVAGGDGTQALVAGIAAEHGLPFTVISAGTRNHFAMDLGLDRDHPDTGLDALTDGVELWLDLGDINGRTFVNNASFGAYAEVVQSPAYRDDKRGTTLRMLPDLLSGRAGPRLVARIDGSVTVDDPRALLVSNNPYQLGDLVGLGRRPRIDTGVLGVVAVTVENAAQAAALVRGRHAGGVRQLVAREVVIESDAAQIPVGVDGEALMLDTPVRCTIRPLALRVRVPKHRPGSPVVTAQLARQLLLHEAAGAL